VASTVGREVRRGVASEDAADATLHPGICPGHRIRAHIVLDAMLTG
jgi:hypothetical protein